MEHTHATVVTCKYTFLRLYLIHVRPHLEYAAVVWDPYQASIIKKLENVQKFALKAATKQ